MMSLELLPGAKLLQPDETPFAGCSALVVLEEVGTSCLRPPPHVFFAVCTRRAHRRRAGTRVACRLRRRRARTRTRAYTYRWRGRTWAER